MITGVFAAAAMNHFDQAGGKYRASSLEWHHPSASEILESIGQLPRGGAMSKKLAAMAIAAAAFILKTIYNKDGEPVWVLELNGVELGYPDCGSPDPTIVTVRFFATRVLLDETTQTANGSVRFEADQTVEPVVLFEIN